MATYVIGDLQGCLAPLRALLGEIGFSPARDRLWLVGDLVNRGPDSLAVLRWAMSLGDSLTTVLGNHDLHLLTVAEGFEKARRGDTLEDILAAPDRTELLDWLRTRPLVHREDDHTLVHAGLLPGWTTERARELAAEVEATLRGPDWRDFLAHMYGNHPDHWDDAHRGFNRLRVITNACSRLRFCTPEGKMEFAHKGELDRHPPGFLPWFEVPGRKSADGFVLFGHWSALGFRLEKNYAALDSGCLWGGAMTALRLEDRRAFQVPCAALRDPMKHG